MMHDPLNVKECQNNTEVKTCITSGS